MKYFLLSWKKNDNKINEKRIIFKNNKNYQIFRETREN